MLPSRSVRRASAVGGAGAIAATALLIIGSGLSSAKGTATVTNSQPPSITASQMLTLGQSVASHVGDSSPTQIQDAEGSRAQANLVASGDIVAGDQPSYLIVERGNFVANNVPVPRGEPAPSGTVLTLVVDATTGEITDEGIQNNDPNLSSLGAVTTLLDASTQGASRRAGHARRAAARAHS